MNLINKIVLTTSVFLSISSHALVLFEPHFGTTLSSGSNTYTFTDSGSGIKFNAGSKFSATHYGTKLGVNVLGLMSGFSYDLSSYTRKYEFTPINSNAVVNFENPSCSRTEIGYFLGYNTPFFLRIWGGYLLNVKETVTATNEDNTKGDYNKGTGYELGIGIAPLSFISFNLQLKTIKFKDAYDAEAKTTSSSSEKITETMASVSFPIDLL